MNPNSQRGQRTGAITPALISIQNWLAVSGMSRSAAYRALASGQLRAVKMGSRTLIDFDHAMAWLRSLPPAEIRIGRKLAV